MAGKTSTEQLLGKPSMAGKINGLHFSHGLINMQINSSRTTLKASGQCADSHRYSIFLFFLTNFMFFLNPCCLAFL